MPTRSKISKKKPATKRRTRAHSNSRSTASASKEGMYVRVGRIDVDVFNSKPKSAAACGPFASIEEARSAILDELIVAIEAAEERLSALKRAKTMDDLLAIASAG